MKLNINLRYGGPVLKGGDLQLKKKAHLLIKNTFLMPGKRSLGAFLHICSPRYFKSDPGDLPERPEKSPTLWGPLTRIYDIQVNIFKI